MLGDQMVRSHQHRSQVGAFADQGNHPTGHAIVATVAELHLDPTVLPTLCSILNSGPGTSCNLASVASWADVVRSKYPWSAPMHYVNAVGDNPPQSCSFGPKGWEGAKNANVLGAIRNNTDLLVRWVQEGSDLNDPIAADALKYLIHFAGDMHMPFHTVGRLQGANGVIVKWGTKKPSEYACGAYGQDLTFEIEFHAMWDGDLVTRAIDTTPSKWSTPLTPEVERHLHGNHYDPLIRKVLVDGIGKTWAGEADSWIKCPTTGSTLSHGGDPQEQIVLQSQWAASDTDDGSVCPFYWAAPIHNLTCDWIWPKQVDENKPPVQLDVDWYGGKITREWVVERFLTMAGLRLAAVLNLIFAR